MNLETPKEAIEELNRIERENEFGLKLAIAFIFIVFGLWIWSNL